MASGSVTCLQVGTYFIQQYYNMLKMDPENAFRFYTDASTMTRNDGDDDTDDKTASSMIDIHTILTSLNFTSIVVDTLKSQDSLNGGILVNVTGTVTSTNFSGGRKFVQVFFLAPQEQGYFVLNDIFQFIDGSSVSQNAVSASADIGVDSEVHAPTSHLEQPASNHDVEEETRDYVNSIRIEDDNPVDKYSIPDEERHETEAVPETVVEEAPAPVEEFTPRETAPVSVVQDPVPSPVEEPVREPVAKTWASIVRKTAPPVSIQPAVRKTAPPPVVQQASASQQVKPTAAQLNPSASSFVPESVGGTDESFTQNDGETNSVYVRSLPSHVTAADIELEFQKFGRIKPDGGIVIKNKKDVGVCFAFVEFEDNSSAQNATKASPLQLLGRQVYIEERRPSVVGMPRGGGVGRGKGRGRGSFQNAGRGGRNPGRGNAFGNGYSH